MKNIIKMSQKQKFEMIEVLILEVRKNCFTNDRCEKIVWNDSDFLVMGNAIAREIGMIERYLIKSYNCLKKHSLGLGFYKTEYHSSLIKYEMTIRNFDYIKLIYDLYMTGFNDSINYTEGKLWEYTTEKLREFFSDYISAKNIQSQFFVY